MTIIADYMGYEYCILFPCARAAMQAYPGVIGLPENICPEVYHSIEIKKLHPINQSTGLADNLPVHLYGYQARNSEEDDLALDPLMTGWLRPLKAKSAIISFGRKKLLSINYGGAFLTNDANLANHMKGFARWNGAFTGDLAERVKVFNDTLKIRFHLVDLWDRYLANTGLYRIPGEQIMPWRVIRSANSYEDRQMIVEAIREEHLPIGTNYPPFMGRNLWGDTVLNFFCNTGNNADQIKRTCEIIERVLDVRSR